MLGLEPDAQHHTHIDVFVVTMTLQLLALFVVRLT